MREIFLKCKSYRELTPRTYKEFPQLSKKGNNLVLKEWLGFE